MENHLESGWACMEHGDYKTAADLFSQGIQATANDAKIHVALAEVLLLQGKFEAGWREFRWRRHFNPGSKYFHEFQSPEWDGRDLPSGSIIVIADEGHGDHVQFARYLPLMAERCKEVVIGWSTGDLEIYQHLAKPQRGSIRTVSGFAELPSDYAAWCLLGDLPHIFKSTDQTTPNQPYLFAQHELSAKWKKCFADTLEQQFRVGLVWSGSPQYHKDRLRSLRLEQIAPLLTTPNCSFVSLQKHIREHDLRYFSQAPPILDLSEQLNDYSETIAAISQLDLVITVDTSIAHIAGAMGKPVWLFARTPSEWRWGISGDSTYLYPSMRLFRQSRPNDWTKPITDMTAELANMSTR